MKLQYIEIGARFEYEGKIFVKTGPITAASDDGGQRVIPRSAILKALDVPNSTPAPTGRFGRLDRQSVITSFDLFYQTCTRLVETTALEELENARLVFLGSIK